MLQRYSDGDERFAEAILRGDLPRLRQAAARELEQVQPQTASVVEMHYFAGLTLEEIAAHTGLTPRQVRHLWNKGRLWLRGRLG